MILVQRRGFFSASLQQDHAIGYLLAAATYLLVNNFTDWGGGCSRSALFPRSSASRPARSGRYAAIA
jgi:hypothetical protein